MESAVLVLTLVKYGWCPLQAPKNKGIPIRSLIGGENFSSRRLTISDARHQRPEETQTRPLLLKESIPLSFISNPSPIKNDPATINPKSAQDRRK
jgi:hypothetical protein